MAGKRAVTDLSYLEAKIATSNFTNGETLRLVKVPSPRGYRLRVVITYKGKQYLYNTAESAKWVDEFNKCDEKLAVLEQRKKDSFGEKAPSKLTPIVMLTPTTPSAKPIENLPKPTVQTTLTPPMDIPLMSPPPVAKSNGINLFPMPEEFQSIFSKSF
uniref:AP2/ERF domain-containing protein n=1 Tax=Panagrellus redivivus TaxID=6233 RepID=A0A7E4VFN5_PANRE